MALEITGKISQILPLESGEGKNGPWKKQPFVLEFMDGNYPKKVCVHAWGDKADAIKSMKEGQNVKVSFNVESREYNGRWFTDVKAWRIESAEAGTAPSNYQEPAFTPETFTNSPDNDLPF